MNKFESFLGEYFEEFIQYRDGLGYVNKNLRYCLAKFDTYIKGSVHEWSQLSPELFLAFQEHLQVTPSSVNNITGVLRIFFQFLLRKGCLHSNPLQGLPAKKENKIIPFIFSPDQIEQLLKSIQDNIRKKESHFLNDLAIYTAIFIQAKCGFRISESLKLQCENYDYKHGTIYIEKTKFHKDRLLPLPKTAQKTVYDYWITRNSLISDSNNPYFLIGNKKGLHNQKIYPVFHQAVKDIGIDQPKRTVGRTVFERPTPHSLRHSFAVNTLKAIRNAGKDPQNALPVLSAYMGHTKYRYTAVYLKVLDAEKRQGLVDFAISHQEEL
jgi:site-specific recombinase XerD